jgi:hypothetical protein
MAGAERLLAALAAAALVSCASGPAPSATSSATAAPGGTDAVAVETPGEPALEPQVTADEFVVTEEVYQRTFEEIEGVIAELDAIIRAGDFPSWERRLTAAYRERTSSREYLEEVSASPLLKQSGVTLACLEDYFRRVVVPSRSAAKLDRLDFVDATHVKAITVIQGEAYILYWLVRENGTWNIGIW